EERKKGVTIDLRHRQFDTDNYNFTFIDAPGHRDFIKNMITGAAQADAAILVVAADDSVQPQTKEHSYLAKVLGIDQLIVAVNKMDKNDYSQERFEEVKEDVQELLQNVGYPGDIEYVPISAYEGDNVAEPSDSMDWYDGPTLFDALDDFEAPEQPIDLPLRVPIQDNYEIKGVGAVPVGRVETGKLETGKSVVFEPASTRLNKDVGGEVKTIEMHHEEVDAAEPGDNVGFNVRGVGKDDVKRGDVAGLPDDTPTVVDEFEAQIIVLDHPNVVTEGYTPVFHVNTAQVACEFKDIKRTVDAESGETKEENPDYVQQGESAVVTLEPKQPLVIEENDDIPQMARFAIRDMDRTVGAGMCLSVSEK
ncbi:MAG: elongation factor 1-alpha, partial [Candidatus Nanohaloarchaea archaeon]|nr:elongation factor 1-alpha [Candidatus Nanohaloarchaea archaeon]